MLLDKSWILMGFKRFKLWGKTKRWFNFVCVTAGCWPLIFQLLLLREKKQSKSLRKKKEDWNEIEVRSISEILVAAEIINSFVINSLCIVVHTDVIGQVVDLNGVQKVQAMGKDKKMVQFRLHDCRKITSAFDASIVAINPVINSID
ncbi:unnamed protein product [Brassica napus]|uniref:(rape) hypothetical protein n=1 Tax=Brassica napus TaxID=3708 RepID=A0A816JXI5_BRANA|nr:unnamed protein product [Brassica napus]